jgi:hypothetical protein
MTCFAAFLTVLYGRRYGLGGVRLGETLSAVGRQLAASGVMAAGLLVARPWLAGIDHTSLDGAIRMAAVLLPAGAVYIGLVTLLGGREVSLLLSTLKRGGRS